MNTVFDSVERGVSVFNSVIEHFTRDALLLTVPSHSSDLTPMTLKVKTILCDMTPCSLVERYHDFEGTSCFHLQHLA